MVVKKNMEMGILKEYTYDDISLFSREISKIKSRFSEDISLTNKITFGNRKIEIGHIMSAPMYDVTGLELSKFLIERNQIPVVHRFMKPNEQLLLFMNTIRHFSYDKNKIFTYTVGIHDCEDKIKLLKEYLNTLDVIIRDGLNILICIDTANGANTLIETPVNIINNFKNEFPKLNIEILAGNIVTAEASRYLYDLGVKFQRVSISTGSACSTSVVTGMYRPPVSAILEIDNNRDRYGLDDLYIVADGGFKETSDMIKAIAVGADFIMSGRLFSGYYESNGELYTNHHGYIQSVNEKTPTEYYDKHIFKTTAYLTSFPTDFNNNIKFFKPYRGMASKEMALLNNTVNNITKNVLPEGVSSMVDFKYDLDGDFENILNSFKSAMSYANSKNFLEFRLKTHVIEISSNSLIQRRPHASI